MNRFEKYTPPVMQCLECDMTCVVCTSFEESTVESLNEVEFTL